MNGYDLAGDGGHLQTPGAFSADARQVQSLQVGDHNDQTNYFGGHHEHHYLSPTVGVSWPVMVGRAPLLADAFQFRPGLRTAIDATLADSQAAVVTQVVAGDGGTGKTQLAASVFREALPGLAVAVWVVAATREAIVAAYAHAYDLLHPTPGGAAAGTGDGQRAAAAFLGWLETTGRSWIVVLDDVADPADLRDLWPAGPAGRVVVTTRRRDAALLGHGRTVVDVGVFTPGEAVDFLTRKLAASPIPGVLVEAEELATDLGFLPLALGQAAAAILDEAITCRTYRARFADATRPLTETFDAETGEDYGRTLASTWTLAVDRADALPPLGLAGRVLRLAAVLDPNGAPEVLYGAPAVLAYLRAGAWSSAGEGIGISAENARRGLRNLHRLSLVSHDPNATARAARMHALAQRATLEHLATEELAAAVTAAADALIQIWPDVNLDEDLASALQANATALAGRHTDALYQPDVHAVLFKNGSSLGEAGQVAAARDYFTDLTQTAETRLGSDHPDTLIARALSARWRGQAGDPAGAATAFEELLTDMVRVLGPDHPRTLTTRHSVARWKGQAGQPAAAAQALQKLLPDRIRVLGPDHPDTLATRHDAAWWQGYAGDAAGAATAFEELLSDRLRVLGPDHPDTLANRHSAMRWQGQAGQPAAAARAAAELLRDRLRVLGPDHPDTLITRSNLAWWTGQAGDPAGAATATRQLLADRLRVLGPDHPDTLTTRHNLAHWQGTAGDPAGAATALKELLDDRLRVLGPDHPDTLTTRQDLAYWTAETKHVH